MASTDKTYRATALTNFTDADISVGGKPVKSGDSIMLGPIDVNSTVVAGAGHPPVPLSVLQTQLAVAPYFRAGQDVYYRVSLADGTPLILLSQHSRPAEVPGKFVYKTLTYYNFRANDIVPFGFVAAELPSGYSCTPQYDVNSMDVQRDSLVNEYDAEARVYQSERLFGTAESRRIAAAQGGNAPLALQKNKDGSQTLVPVNYIPIESAVTGRGAKDYARDSYRDDDAIEKASEFISAPIRAEQWLQTRSSRGDFGELTNVRMMANTNTPTAMLNLTPVYASAECRQRQADRINKIQEAYINARLGSEL